MRDALIRKAVLFVVFAAVSCIGLCAGAEKVEYRMRFEAGKKYRLRKVVEQRVTRVVGGGEHTLDQVTEMVSDFDVQDVEPDGSAWINYAYRESSLRLKGPGVDVEFDSKDKKTTVPIEAIGFALILGESFYIKMAPDGGVEKINGLDTMLSSVRGKIPNVRQKAQILESMKRQLNEGTVSRELEGYFAIYPDKAVGVGESWSRKPPASEVSAQIVETTWLVKEVKDGVVVVEVGIVVKSNPKAEPVDVRGVKMRREISGTGTGLIEIEESSGMIIHSEVTQETKEQMRVVPGGPIRRRESTTELVKTHRVVTFEMSERAEPAVADGNQPASLQ